MIQSNLISTKTIIAKVIADLQLKESEINISDIREWIYEAVLKIGAIQQFEHKVQILPIVGHQAKLPCDLYKLGQVAYSFNNSNSWLPMRKCTSSFGVYHDKKCINKPEMLIQDNKLIPLVRQLFDINNDKDALLKISNDKDLRDTLCKLLNNYTEPSVNGQYVKGSRHQDNTMYSIDLQYMTKPGYIMTNVPSGKVKIEYYAIYTDDDSLPMIPNMESYKEAIFWYVTMKLLYPKRLSGTISDRIYYDAQNSWNFYRKNAYSEAMMPSSVDDMATISNTWNKLYPEVNDEYLFMSTTGEEQNIFNQN